MSAQAPNQQLSRAIFHGISTIATPLLFARSRLSSAWRPTYAERSGRGPWSELPIAAPGSRIWLHGASVGEIQGVDPLSRRLSAEFSSVEQVITCTSTTGRDEVLRRKLSSRAFLLPHDLTGPVSRVIDRIAPGLVVIAETEIWPTLLLSLSKRAIPIVIVNGRISDRTIGRYQVLKPVLRPVLAGIEKFLVQTGLDAERFSAIGAAQSKIVVTGSSKYDQEVAVLTEAERVETLNELGLAAANPIFVAGSVRPGEDEDVISAYLAARQVFSNLQMIIAPRHADRFEPVAELLRAEGVEFNRRTAGPAAEPRPVVLLDSIGELGRLYALATIAFVGGTLVKVGGHNPFEPARYGVCVLMGPHVQNVRDAVASLRREGGALIVENRRELESQIVDLLGDLNGLARRGAAAKKVWQGNLGATDRIVAHLRPRLDRMTCSLNLAALSNRRCEG